MAVITIHRTENTVSVKKENTARWLPATTAVVHMSGFT